jgi:hypothetical protein
LKKDTNIKENKKIEKDFLLLKQFVFEVPHFYILWKILENPPIGRPNVAEYN